MSDEEVVDARYVHITFNDGSVRRFAFEPIAVEPSMLASAFQKFIDQGYISLVMDDRTVLIPIANVQTLEVFPKPEVQLPGSVTVLHEFED